MQWYRKINALQLYHKYSKNKISMLNILHLFS